MSKNDMSKQFDLSLRPEPFWLQEAFACMNYVHVLDSEEWLNEDDGWSRRRKEEFLLPYRSYRGAMRVRLQPILAQYPLLAGYVDTTPRDLESLKSYEPPIMSFLVQMQYVLEAEKMPSEEKLEAELNQAFERMLTGGMEDFPEEEEVKLQVTGLSDVMAALEGWQGSDADKFKLLRLYSERREVMEQLWSFQGSCKEIGRECLESVQERFDACMEELKKPETIGAFLEKVGIQCEGKYSGQITPVILPYNRCLLQMKELQEEAGHTEVKLHVGIEVFYLYRNVREENLYHDERLVARLKALGDPTRLKILHQLVERPCYLQEMAKSLGLTPATVLHHLGVLISEGLIEIQMTAEKKKVYYQIKKRGLEEVSQGILQLAMTRKEREENLRLKMQEGQQAWGGRQWVIQK